MVTQTKTTKTATQKAVAQRRAKVTPAAKKLSQIAAAERVLAKAGQPMTCKAMIEAMAAQGLWTSPAGKTPEATLYAALLRHIRTKGKQARFQKVGCGQFALA